MGDHLMWGSGTPYSSTQGEQGREKGSSSHTYCVPCREGSPVPAAPLLSCVTLGKRQCLSEPFLGRGS